MWIIMIRVFVNDQKIMKILEVCEFNFLYKKKQNKNQIRHLFKHKNKIIIN